MKNPAFIHGTLLKRYKRFLADVKLADGTVVTAYCPNTGTMRSCSDPGSPVCLSKSDNPNRKHPLTWELIYTNNAWVGVNTHVPNTLVFQAIQQGLVPELADYDDIRREVKYGKNSRIDILLSTANTRCYVEIKNVSLVEENIARFPDAVTVRGTKHLNELMDMLDLGHRAVMFYLVQRGDGALFRPADDIDPVYAETLRKAHNKGVEILVYQADVSIKEITLGTALPFEL